MQGFRLMLKILMIRELFRAISYIHACLPYGVWIV